MNIINNEDCGIEASEATKFDPTIGVKPVKYISLRRQITNKKGHPLTVRYSEDPNRTGIFFGYEGQVQKKFSDDSPCTTFTAEPGPQFSQQGSMSTKGRLLLVRYAENQCKTGIFGRQLPNSKFEKKVPENSCRPSPPPSPLASSSLTPRNCQQSEVECQEQNLVSKTRFTVNTFCRRFCCARK